MVETFTAPKVSTKPPSIVLYLDGKAGTAIAMDRQNASSTLRGMMIMDDPFIDTFLDSSIGPSCLLSERFLTHRFRLGTFWERWSAFELATVHRTVPGLQCQSFLIFLMTIPWLQVGNESYPNIPYSWGVLSCNWCARGDSSPKIGWFNMVYQKLDGKK